MPLGNGDAILLTQEIANGALQAGSQIRAIADAALPYAESILSKRLLKYKRDRHELIMLNPTRADKSLRSFKFNLRTGKWADFATGATGGDLVSLVAYLDGIEQTAAARLLADELGIDHTLGFNRKQGRTHQKQSPSKEPTPGDFYYAGLGVPVAVWPYHDVDGNIVAYAARYDTAEGKEFRPWTLNESKDEWVCKGLKLYPLYNLQELLARPDAAILFVEGEKTADAAKKLFPDFVVVTSFGGCNAVKNTDWRPLEGRRVIIWPDNDGPGREFAEVAVQICKNIAAASVGTVDVPEAWPDKWDLADRLPLGVLPETLDEMVQAALLASELILNNTGQQGTDKTDKSPSVSGVGGHYSENAGDNWPDPAPLPSSLTPVQEFDFAFLPEPLAVWGKDIANRLQCPPDYVGVAIIAALSAVIGRKIGIRPQQHTDWTEIPNLWAVLIGRPGVLKSPAMEAVLTHLRHLAAIASDKYKEEQAEYKKQEIINKVRAEVKEKTAKDRLKKNPNANVDDLFDTSDTEPPSLKRYITNDPTPAALGELLINNPNGILVYRDEIVSLWRSLDREDNTEGKGFYLTAWNGNSAYIFDRIGRGMNLHIEGVCISQLGSTQPGKISNYLRSAIKQDTNDDGLIQRYGLLVWPDTPTIWNNVDCLPDIEAKKAVWKIFKWLDELDPKAIGCNQDTDFEGNPTDVPFLRFDDAALELFVRWRTKLETEVLRSDEIHPALESHFAKYRKLVPALALIFYLSELCEQAQADDFEPTGLVDETAMLRALSCAEYLESHAIRAYSSVTAAQTATAKQILKHIRNRDLKDGFSARDIYRRQWSQLTEPAVVREALEMLCDYEYLVEQTNNTGGRSSKTYLINPKLLA